IAQLYNAAKFGKEDAIRKLLAEGVEPDLKSLRHVSPLWISATRGHLKVVQILLSTKLVDVNSQSTTGRPPIFWAAASGYHDIVRLLLQAGADPSLIDENGNTLLSIAKQNGHDKITKMSACK
ncbi:ankyrin repeat protein, partial [Hyaloscypha bicolor E]